MTEDGEVVIPKAWRSEYRNVIAFFVFGLGGSYLTNQVPEYLLLKGRLFALFGYEIYLTIPVLWFFSVFFIGLAIFRIYNVRYVLDGRGIEAFEWVLGPQRVKSIRYEDIRSIEAVQTIIGRILDIGDLEIGTAAQSTIELTFKGIAAPHEVLNLIQRERDRRHQLESSAYPNQGRVEE